MRGLDQGLQLYRDASFGAHGTILLASCGEGDPKTLAVKGPGQELRNAQLLGSREIQLHEFVLVNSYSLGFKDVTP